MMKIISIDIETTGIEPIPNYENKEEEIRITTICCYEKELDRENEKIFFNEDEKKMIIEFLYYCDENREAEWIGYNIKNFDIPFIVLRALKYNLLNKKSHINLLKKGINYWYNPYIIDLAKIFQKEWNKNRKLNNILKFLNLQQKKGNGDGAIELFKNKKYDDLINYCMNDCKITMKLYEYCEENGVL